MNAKWEFQESKIDSLTQQAKNRIRQENKLQQRNRIWHETRMTVFW
jgi:hypothetical protein